jgi:DNA-directed RNA polymerase subunit alpha
MVAELLEITRSMQRRLATGGIFSLMRGDVVQMTSNPFRINLETPIDHLDLTVRSYNALKRNGITTLDKLTAMTERDLLDLRNMGRGNVDEIRSQLRMLRLDLSEE